MLSSSKAGEKSKRKRQGTSPYYEFAYKNGETFLVRGDVDPFSIFGDRSEKGRKEKELGNGGVKNRDLLPRGTFGVLI